MSKEHYYQNKHDDMDIEDSGAQHSRSSYHMSSTKFYCEHCEREFSVLNPDNNAGTCPRCERVSHNLFNQQRHSQSQNGRQGMFSGQPQSQQNRQQQQGQGGENEQDSGFIISQLLGLLSGSPNDASGATLIRGPGQAVFTHNIGPFSFGQSFPRQSHDQQRQQPSQAPPQHQPEEQNRTGFWGNVLHYGGAIVTGIVGGLLQRALTNATQQSPFNAFNGNPQDLFGNSGNVHHHQSYQQVPRRNIIFQFNPMELLFGAGSQGQGHSQFTFSPADYERLVEEFIRNDDPNSYGAPPASNENMNKLREFNYEPGKCKAVDCAVCQEDYNKGDKLVDLPCNHTYHKDCVLEWLKRHDACPVCRKPLNSQDQQQQRRPEQANTNSNQQNTRTYFGF